MSRHLQGEVVIINANSLHAGNEYTRLVNLPKHHMRNQIPETSFLVFRQADHVYRQLKQTPHGPVYKMGQMIVHPPRSDSEGNDIYIFPVIDVNADYSKLGKNQTRGAA